jgi:hypothetical protein
VRRFRHEHRILLFGVGVPGWLGWGEAELVAGVAD